jgi:hypothetical protein
MPSKGREFVGTAITSMPSLPDGWHWAIYYQDSDPNRPTASAALETTDQDCFVYVEDERLAPGKKSLRITTGVAPAEVVAAVLKANRVKA